MVGRFGDLVLSTRIGVPDSRDKASSPLPAARLILIVPYYSNLTAESMRISYSAVELGGEYLRREEEEGRHPACTNSIGLVQGVRIRLMPLGPEGD